MRSKFGSRPSAILRSEQLESRQVLAAIFPAYVDGAFSLGTSGTGAPYGLENTFLLESNPSATKTIYLDFNGHHSFNNSWGHDIEFPAFDRNGNPNVFTDNELIEIQQQFQNVAEDFLPFDVNVTTQDPGVDALIKSNSADQEYGVRMVATQATDGFGNGIGGVAFLNSFDDSVDNPVFAFNKGARNGGMTASHEVGHALGLSHDGLNSQSYHPGTGSGATSWGPIMGAPFNKVVTQWSNGDYAGATTTQNDLAIITKPANGFTYRTDDFGDSINAAHELTAIGESIFEWGVIERNTDLDYFSFNTAQGVVDIDLRSFQQDPNLDIEARLYDATGAEIATSNPLNDTDASFSLDLDAGTYYMSIDGVGRDGRYSDYGSLGFYTISATVVAPSTIDGDFNDDGLWDTTDIDLLVADIVSGGTPVNFDLNGDGGVDNQDVDQWLAEAGSINLASGNAYLRGDANLDGLVDGQDFVTWNVNKFSTLAAWSGGDFDANGIIDGNDFVIWNTNKFQTAALSSGQDAGFNDAADPFGDAPFWPFAEHDHDHDLDHHDDLHIGDQSAEPLLDVPTAVFSARTVTVRESHVDGNATRDAQAATSGVRLGAYQQRATDIRSISRQATGSATQHVRAVDALFGLLG